MTLRALFQRLTGREAAALRHQRDAYAEQAGVERRRADTATALLRDDKSKEAEIRDMSARLAHANKLYRAVEVALMDLDNGWLSAINEAALRDAIDPEQAAATLAEVPALRRAEMERDKATHLLRALVRDRDEAALAEAAEWLRRRGPTGWFPGEQTPDDTLPSAAERD